MPGLEANIFDDGPARLKGGLAPCAPIRLRHGGDCRGSTWTNSRGSRTADWPVSRRQRTFPRPMRWNSPPHHIARNCGAFGHRPTRRAEPLARGRRLSAAVPTRRRPGDMRLPTDVRARRLSKRREISLAGFVEHPQGASAGGGPRRRRRWRRHSEPEPPARPSASSRLAESAKGLRRPGTKLCYRRWPAATRPLPLRFHPRPVCLGEPTAGRSPGGFRPGNRPAAGGRRDCSRRSPLRRAAAICVIEMLRSARTSPRAAGRGEAGRQTRPEAARSTSKQLVRPMRSPTLRPTTPLLGATLAGASANAKWFPLSPAIGPPARQIHSAALRFQERSTPPRGSTTDALLFDGNGK